MSSLRNKDLDNQGRLPGQRKQVLSLAAEPDLGKLRKAERSLNKAFEELLVDGATSELDAAMDKAKAAIKVALKIAAAEIKKLS